MSDESGVVASVLSRNSEAAYDTSDFLGLKEKMVKLFSTEIACIECYIKLRAQFSTGGLGNG
jgi:hypothetical protein